ncbi:DUF4230 domain-containing protein [Polaribacter sp. R2A056_3_33]|jgi:hypothetical protein|uniref:DUF4230 domain-containing protein n=1 Tax=unclassified Polaribacter TaxID=196858 RepID=UPI001C4E98F3|nr:MULTISPECIES: DUF4230 domain-containing protein [unclassified Polaribacter]QXP63340.1 DUF4230 domain-containing protein [Polaribacter sp. HaHaR_3_91]QXP71334.1 DUF4230 domain-containing protein [Polaribacter sp. R2A056_3_33]
MNSFLKYLAVFLFGFFIAKFWYDKKERNHKQEEIQVVVTSIKNLSKLVVSKGTFSEVYNYSDSKKYFYDYLSFDKKAIVTVNATVEVGYDLSKLEIQIDSVGKKIYINKIPKEEVVISPDIKYFDLQQSQFNTFSKYDLNKINKTSIEKIKETIEVTDLKEKAKIRLLEELSKIYQLSAVYNWQVIDNTNSGFLSNFKN